MFSPLRFISRWWRSRGNGVHSPFAFRFISNVLRQTKTPYYAYDEIERMGGDVRWHKLLFRLVCEFEPDCIVFPSDATEDDRAAVRLADSRAIILPSPKSSAGRRGITLINNSNSTPAGNSRTKVTVIRDIRSGGGKGWRRVKSGMQSGMTFTNGRTGIAVEREGLPRQDFEICFR